MDTLSAGSSPLHRLDPRAKLITTLAFIIAVVSFDKYSVSALVPFSIYPVYMISLGGLPAGFIFRKVLLVMPFALVIGMFNPLMDTGTLVYAGSLGISGGWISFLSILMRFTLTVSAALALIALTGINAVCESLLKFGVPKPFVVQLLMFNRYMFVMTDEAERMARARALRSFGKKTMGFKVYASLLGHLLLRSFDRAERIYRAMRCRGFNGHIPMIRYLRSGVKEAVFAGGWITAFVIFRAFNIPLKLGTIITELLK